jgi:hypothetical protein
VRHVLLIPVCLGSVPHREPAGIGGHERSRADTTGSEEPQVSAEDRAVTQGTDRHPAVGQADSVTCSHVVA